MEKKLVAWPIDNKHVLEDFADDLSGTHHIERSEGGWVYYAFYEEFTLWELQYKFGQNRFAITMRSYPNAASLLVIKERVLDLSDEENGLFLRIIEERENGLLCEFLKEVWE